MFATVAGGRTRLAGHRRRSAALLAAFAVTTMGSTVWMGAGEAHAFGIGILPPVVAAVPTSLAVASSVTTGVGAVSFFGASTAGVSTTAVGATAAAGVALAPVAVAAGAALVVGGAVALGWRWANGNDEAGPQLDPPQTGGGISQGVAYATPGYGACMLSCTYSGIYTGRTDTGMWIMRDSQVGEGDWTYKVYGSDGAVIGSGAGSGNAALNTSVPNVFARGAYLGRAPAGAVGVTFYTPYTPTSGAPCDSVVIWGQTPCGVSAPPAGPGAAGSTVITTTPTSECKKVDGGIRSVAGPAISYTGGTKPAELPGIVAPACPVGEPRVGLTTPSTFPDGSTAPSPIAPWTAPIVPSAYPDCQGAAGCVLTLTRTSPDGEVKNCTNTGVCTGYQAAPGPDAEGNTYQCKWGPYLMPAGDCTVIPTLPNPELPPKNAPEGPPLEGPNPGDPDGEGCLAAGWSWNPVSWVFSPVKCALRWAFVPSETPLERAQETATALGEAPPFTYVTSTVGWVGDLGADSECFTLEAATPWGSQRVVSTCEPGPFIGWLVSHRTLMSAALYAAFFVPMCWWAWRQYAPGSQGMA